MFERISWLVLALIHLSPFGAFFAPSLITRLYSIPDTDPSFPLLHHRAALFGVIFIACVWASFSSDIRKLTFVITALSMISFLVIYVANGQPSSLRTIAIADIIGLPFLAYVGWKSLAV